MKYFYIVLLLFSNLFASAPIDSLIFKNGDVMVGEVKSMDRGVVIIETDYSDSDFQIEWAEIKKIKTQSIYMVTLEDGRKYYGSLSTTPELTITIIAGGTILVECPIKDIVHLGQYKTKYLDRISASIDIGFSLTKANNLRQYNSRSSIGYRTRKWSTEASLNSLNSTQKDVEPIRRVEGAINFRYILPKRWYPTVTISTLTNTEQKLDFRLNAQIGMGRYIIRTNSSYWGASIGVNRNLERFSNETEDRNSWEGYMGTELNLYDIGDLSLLTNIVVYPGITEHGRWRSDFTFDIKYDLPLDFYIKLGFTFNYDNRPAEGADELDYVFQTGLGWEW
jgi:hypothetical protein